VRVIGLPAFYGLHSRGARLVLPPGGRSAYCGVGKPATPHPRLREWLPPLHVQAEKEASCARALRARQPGSAQGRTESRSSKSGCISSQKHARTTHTRCHKSTRVHCMHVCHACRDIAAQVGEGGGASHRSPPCRPRPTGSNR
jgi:hypothetical protein